MSKFYKNIVIPVHKHFKYKHTKISLGIHIKTIECSITKHR